MVRKQMHTIRLTQGPGHHLYGYYDKHQWDPGNRYILGLQTPYMDKLSDGTDVAVLGVIDQEGDLRFQPVAETRTWSWQQGCMAQWFPTRPDWIVYNDRIADRFVAILLHVGTKEQRTLPRPIYSISRDERWALSLNFSRLGDTRPECGYQGLADPWCDDPHPSGDGIYVMELETGNHGLVVSIGELAHFDREPSMEGARHWVNHLLFNPSGERFIFLHRWREPGAVGFRTRMYTANRDGSELHRVPLEGASHFIWQDDARLLVWGRTPEHGDAFYLVDDRSDRCRAVGKGVLNANGHITYSPDGRWLLTDAERWVILYRLEDGARFDVAHFPAHPELRGVFRCDLHPRWNRSGDMVCVDSAHEGSRQMYLVDVGALTRGLGST